ncbi:hypothetical protein [Paenibacillus jiagnxiensis]|uniref:hypothetical protein n=1 Tax=Paenibacillus jiagnxiensis TaxID=3228926 RepID=UPI0033A8DD72
MNKKTRSTAETLLFVFCLSFTVFVLIFILIATVVMISKNHRKGGTLFSLFQTEPEQASAPTDPLQPEMWPAETVTVREDKSADTDTASYEIYAHSKRELH